MGYATLWAGSSHTFKENFLAYYTVRPVIYLAQFLVEPHTSPGIQAKVLATNRVVDIPFSNDAKELNLEPSTYKACALSNLQLLTCTIILVHQA